MKILSPSGTRLNLLVKEHPDAVAAAICGILVFLGWLALNLNWVGLSLLILPTAYVIGGYQSAREGLTTLFEEKQLDVDLLMIVAALGAASLGLWRQEYYLIVDGAVLILIFAISGALEGYAMQRTERDIRSLMSLTPDTARVILNREEHEIPIDKLQVGDEVLVKPGELIPTDAIITQGYSSLNEASITGESLPVEKTVGDEVFAGTLNGNGALTLKVHQPPESSLIQRVIQLVQQAQTESPPSQLFIERFERGYALIIVGLGLLLATLPPFLLNWDWETTIYRALVFLVVASPCALMAAIMPTLLSGIANGARQGILFKSGAQLEMMGKVRAIAFDLPEDKVSVIRRLQRQYQTVAMVGDGINDAPALAQASVGIAMGVAGSDVALETADIVLVADRLEKLEQAINLGRRSQNIIKQNIIFALSFIILLLISNFAGNITMPLGVIGHEGSTVLVTLSGLRLLRK